MNITLIAHDKKKELMIQFCTAYKSILSKHTLSATATTGRMVADATGLPVSLFMARSQGGYQQIDARVAYNEIDMVFTYRPQRQRPLGGAVRFADHPPVRHPQRPGGNQPRLGGDADFGIAAGRFGLERDDPAEKDPALIDKLG